MLKLNEELEDSSTTQHIKCINFLKNSLTKHKKISDTKKEDTTTLEFSLQNEVQVIVKLATEFKAVAETKEVTDKEKETTSTNKTFYDRPVPKSSVGGRKSSIPRIQSKRATSTRETKKFRTEQSATVRKPEQKVS